MMIIRWCHVINTNSSSSDLSNNQLKGWIPKQITEAQNLSYLYFIPLLSFPPLLISSLMFVRDLSSNYLNNAPADVNFNDLSSLTQVTVLYVDLSSPPLSDSL